MTVLWAINQWPSSAFHRVVEDAVIELMQERVSDGFEGKAASAEYLHELVMENICAQALPAGRA